MMNLKVSIQNKFEELNKMLRDDDYVNPDMLDKAMSVIYEQNRYIKELEKQSSKVYELHDKLCKEVIKTYEAMNKK